MFDAFVVFNLKAETGNPSQSSGSLGAGDSYLVLDVLPEELANVAFENLRKEVKWDTMHHRGMCR
jgi:hypothetical protein